MATTLETTPTPGVYKRGSSYQIQFRVNGRKHYRTFRTYDEARRTKSGIETDVHRGEYSGASNVALCAYLAEWIESYQGGRTAIRPQTRDEYRGMLRKYALRWFSSRLRLTELTPKHVADFVRWLSDPRAQAKHHHSILVEEAQAAGKRPPKPLAPGATRVLARSSIQNAVKPLRSALAEARREGVIRHNPCDGLVLPHRASIEEDEDEVVRVFPAGVMDLVVDLIHPGYRTMFRLLAATGLRRGELFGLLCRDLQLDGGSPCVRVRRSLRRQSGKGLVLGPPKSGAAKRSVPIPLAMADELHVHVMGLSPDDHVFRTGRGTPLSPDNVYNRVLKPALAEAGIDYGGYHVFRHTVASILFAQGRNIKVVQHWLGHSSPTLTLSTYIHLLSDDDLGGPLDTVAPLVIPDALPEFGALEPAQE